MKNNRNLFSKLPKVDEILNKDKIIEILKSQPREIVIESIRECIDEIRQKLINNLIDENEFNILINNIEDVIVKKSTQKISNNLRKVVNATGTVIHTNLGRSLISKKAMVHVLAIASNYSNLEYDIENGKRGSRYSHIEKIISRITGAESALVVNNNAAAVMLVLSTMAKDKEVVISRGELVEIGGSFRIPEVMEQSGAKLVDVGTTNKTHSFDYTNAISDETGVLLKVHTSNYRIVGFTEGVNLDELVDIGKEKNIPVVEDIGSGVLIDLSKYGLQYEPTVQESINAGVDIVTFSGDKLLGGPQAGIIVGKKKYIDNMKKNPLTRAIRVDKFTISALEEILKLYLNEEDAVKEIPTLRMLTMNIAQLEEMANKLYTMIKDSLDDTLNVEIIDQFSQVGGGSMPLEQIPTKAIMISSEYLSTPEIERGLREFDIPVIGRIYKDKLLLDVRTISFDDFNIIVNALKSIRRN